MDRKWDLVLRAEGGTEGLFFVEDKLREEANRREITFLDVSANEERVVLKAAFKDVPVKERLERRRFKGYSQDETGTDEFDIYASQGKAKLEVIGWMFSRAAEALRNGDWIEIWAGEFPPGDPDSILDVIYEEEDYRAVAWLTAYEEDGEEDSEEDEDVGE